MKARDGLRSLVGTLCGACIVTLVALCFSAAPARAQNPTCVAVGFFPPSPVQQNSTETLRATVFQVNNPSIPCLSQNAALPTNFGSGTLFASVNSNNVQTSCALGTATKQIATMPLNNNTGFSVDTSTIGTFGYEVSFAGVAPFDDPSVSPCIDLVVTAPPPCISIAADLASGPGMPFAGTTNEWTVQLHIHACQDITALKAQGGSNGWATNIIPSNPSPNPSVGTASVKQNNKNQVITWTLADLGQGTAGGTDATLLINITGTIKRNTTPFTILDLLGNFSLSYSLDGVQQKTSLAGTVTVQVMPPLEPPM